MAGKTFPGIGDLEDESPPLDPADAADSASVLSSRSGPTVVDEAKVEQGLKKLRSLDAPPGPLTGIHRALSDVLDDPSRATPEIPIDVQLMPSITIDPVRGTAMGRSVSEPVLSEQPTKPFDDRHLRGTMFGHSVHVPDLDLPARKQEVETSKALAIVERGQTTSNEIAIFQPGPYGQRAGIPLGQTPYPNSSRFHSTPIDLRTTSSRKKIVVRVTAAAACIAALVVAALLWVRSNSEDGEPGPRPAATVAAPALRAIEAPPSVPPAVAPPTERPAPPAVAPPVAPPSMASGVALPAAAAPKAKGLLDDDDLPNAPPAPAKAAPAPAAGPVTPTARRHATATHGERRHAAPEAAPAANAKADQPDEAPAPAKPARTKRQAAEEDPDATMAPTIE